MTKTIDLSVAQRAILTTACERRGGFVLPLTVPLKGGAVTKVIASLITKGLVNEVPASGKQEPWRTGEDGASMTLKATAAAYEALGLAKPKRASGIAPKAEEPARAAARGERGDTKQAQVIAMLNRQKGATIAEIVDATGWQPHTVRGFFAGALKKRLGLAVASDKIENRGRVYRVL